MDKYETIKIINALSKTLERYYISDKKHIKDIAESLAYASNHLRGLMMSEIEEEKEN